MELIPQWRAWYKRWSTWLLLVMSSVSLNDIYQWLPTVEQYMDPVVYKFSMMILPLIIVGVINIKQKNMPGSAS